MARPAAPPVPAVMNNPARARHPLGGLELPDDWLAWKPFGFAREMEWKGPPVEKFVEAEEDLHIFGLVAAVNLHDADSAAQEPDTPRGNHQHHSGRAKAPRFRAAETTFAPPQQPPAHLASCRYDEFGGTGHGGGGWGTVTGRETPSAAGHEERRSAAIPRAFAMNTDMAAHKEGFGQDARALYPSEAHRPHPQLPPQQRHNHYPQPPLPQERLRHPQQAHPRQHWAALNAGACHEFHQDEGQCQAQVYPNGGWQQDQQQQQQQQPPPPQQQQQQQYGVYPPPHFFGPRRCPALFLPRQFLPPPMPAQYPHLQHPNPQRGLYVNPYHQGQCLGCCRGPCQCEHMY